MLSKKRNDNGDDDDNTVAVDSRQRRIMNLVYVFMIMMKSEISFVWHVSNLTLYHSHLIHFRFHLIVLLIKKSFLTYYHRTMNLHVLFASHVLLWLFITLLTTMSTFFLIRFKDRKFHQRSALQAQICLSCNEKIEKKKKLSLRLCLST